MLDTTYKELTALAEQHNHKLRVGMIFSSNTSSQSICLEQSYIYFVSIYWIFIILCQWCSMGYYTYLSTSSFFQSTDAVAWKWIMKAMEQVLHFLYLYTSLAYIAEFSPNDDTLQSHNNVHIVRRFDRTFYATLRVPYVALNFIVAYDFYLLLSIMFEGPAKAFVRESTGFFWMIKIWTEYFFVDRALSIYRDHLNAFFMVLQMINISLILNNFPEGGKSVCTHMETLLKDENKKQLHGPTNSYMRGYSMVNSESHHHGKNTWSTVVTSDPANRHTLCPFDPTALPLKTAVDKNLHRKKMEKYQSMVEESKKKEAKEELKIMKKQKKAGTFNSRRNLAQETNNFIRVADAHKSEENLAKIQANNIVKDLQFSDIVSKNPGLLHASVARTKSDESRGRYAVIKRDSKMTYKVNDRVFTVDNDHSSYLNRRSQSNEDLSESGISSGKMSKTNTKQNFITALNESQNFTRSTALIDMTQDAVEKFTKSVSPTASLYVQNQSVYGTPCSQSCYVTVNDLPGSNVDCPGDEKTRRESKISISPPPTCDHHIISFTNFYEFSINDWIHRINYWGRKAFSMGTYQQDLRMIKLHLVFSSLPLLFGRFVQIIGGCQAEISVDRYRFSQGDFDCYTGITWHSNGTFDTYTWLFCVAHVGFLLLASSGYINKTIEGDLHGN